MVSSRLLDEQLDEMARQELSPLLLRPVAAWDLDSTVRSTMHRRYLVPEVKAGRATWADYSMLCGDDVPILGSVALMRELAGFSHVGISGSSALARDITAKWCGQHEVPLGGLMMRPEGWDEEVEGNGWWKVRCLRALRRAGADVRLFFEDWREAAECVAAETGIPVVGINPFDAEPEAAHPL